MLADHPHIGDGEIRRGRPRLLPIAQGAHGHPEAAGELRLREAKPCPRLADQPCPLPPIQRLDRDIKVLGIRRISRQREWIVLLPFCPFSPR